MRVIIDEMKKRKILGFVQVIIAFIGILFLGLLLYKVFLTPMKPNYERLIPLTMMLVFAITVSLKLGIRNYKLLNVNNILKIIGWFGVLILITGLVFASFNIKTPAIPNDEAEGYTLPINSKAPIISGVTLSGDSLKIEDYSDKFIFIDFWASWCVPCLAEAPYINELINRVDTSKIVVLGVNRDINLENARKIANLNYNFPSLIDTSNQIAKNFNVSGIPKNYLISPSGIIIAQNLYSDNLLPNVMKYVHVSAN